MVSTAGETRRKTVTNWGMGGAFNNKVALARGS